MANFFSSELGSGQGGVRNWPTPGVGHGGRPTHGARGEVRLATALQLGDTIQLFDLPPHARIESAYIKSDDLDSGGSALRLSIGDAENTARFFTNTQASANGGVDAIIAIDGRDFLTTKKTRVFATVTTAPTTGATGTLVVRLNYSVEEPANYYYPAAVNSTQVVAGGTPTPTPQQRIVPVDVNGNRAYLIQPAADGTFRANLIVINIGDGTDPVSTSGGREVSSGVGSVGGSHASRGLAQRMIVQSLSWNPGDPFTATSYDTGSSTAGYGDNESALYNNAPTGGNAADRSWTAARYHGLGTTGGRSAVTEPDFTTAATLSGPQVIQQTIHSVGLNNSMVNDEVRTATYAVDGSFNLNKVITNPTNPSQTSAPNYQAGALDLAHGYFNKIGHDGVTYIDAPRLAETNFPNQSASAFYAYDRARGITIKYTSNVFSLGGYNASYPYIWTRIDSDTQPARNKLYLPHASTFNGITATFKKEEILSTPFYSFPLSYRPNTRGLTDTNYTSVGVTISGSSRVFASQGAGVRVWHIMPFAAGDYSKAGLRYRVKFFNPVLTGTGSSVNFYFSNDPTGNTTNAAIRGGGVNATKVLAGANSLPVYMQGRDINFLTDTTAATGVGWQDDGFDQVLAPLGAVAWTYDPAVNGAGAWTPITGAGFTGALPTIVGGVARFTEDPTNANKAYLTIPDGTLTPGQLYCVRDGSLPAETPQVYAAGTSPNNLFVQTTASVSTGTVVQSLQLLDATALAPREACFIAPAGGGLRLIINQAANALARNLDLTKLRIFVETVQ